MSFAVADTSLPLPVALVAATPLSALALLLFPTPLVVLVAIPPFFALASFLLKPPPVLALAA